MLDEARSVMMKQGDRLSIPLLMQYPAPETILYELLKPYGFSRVVSNEVFLSLRKESGKLFYSPLYRLIKDRDYLLIGPIPKEEFRTYILTEEQGHCTIPIELSWTKIVLSKEFRIKKDKYIAYFDYDKLQFPLVLRRWNEGDWFVPFGMNGRKKLSDYFSDNKFSRLQKEQTWLLCCGDDILWIVGERIDNRFRIDKITKRVVVVNFFDK